MADNNANNSGSNSFLSFVIGGLLVAVVVIGWILYNGGMVTKDQPDIKIEVPGVGSVEGSVKGDSGGGEGGISIEGDASAQ